MAEFDRYQQQAKQARIEARKRRDEEAIRHQQEQEARRREDLQALQFLQITCRELSMPVSEMLTAIQAEKLLKEGIIARYNVNELANTSQRPPRLIQPSRPGILGKLFSQDGFSKTHCEIRTSTVYSDSVGHKFDAKRLDGLAGNELRFKKLLSECNPNHIVHTLSLGSEDYTHEKDGYGNDMGQRAWYPYITVRGSYSRTEQTISLSVTSTSNWRFSGLVHHEWGQAISTENDPSELKDIFKQQLAICFGFEK